MNLVRAGKPAGSGKLAHELRIRLASLSELALEAHVRAKGRAARRSRGLGRPCRHLPRLLGLGFGFGFGFGLGLGLGLGFGFGVGLGFGVGFRLGLGLGLG